MYRCECYFAINANVCTICTYTVNKVNLNLLRGQEVWCDPSTGASMVPANGQKLKNLLNVVLVGKPLHLNRNIYI